MAISGATTRSCCTSWKTRTEQEKAIIRGKSWNLQQQLWCQRIKSSSGLAVDQRFLRLGCCSVDAKGKGLQRWSHDQWCPHGQCFPKAVYGDFWAIRQMWISKQEQRLPRLPSATKTFIVTVIGFLLKIKPDMLCISPVKPQSDLSGTCVRVRRYKDGPFPNAR